MLTSVIESAKEAQRTGAWDDALAHYETALSLIPDDNDGRDRADVLRHIGTVHRDRGDLEQAAQKYEESRAEAEAQGLKEHAAMAIINLATVEMMRGNIEQASDLYLQARSMVEALGNDRLVAMCDQNLGILANIQGNVAVALLSYRSALERYRRLGDEITATQALINMGMANVDLQEWEAAEQCFAEAAEIASRTGDVQMVGLIDLNRTELHLKRRRFDAAKESVDRSMRVFHRLRSKRKIAEAYKFYGMLYRETARPDESDTHFALSLGMAEACQNKLLQAETQMEWALLHMEEERKQEGILYLNRALGLFRELKASREVLDIERRLERLKEMYVPAVHGWGAKLSEAKDPFQVGHSQRVADYASKLGRELGVNGWDLTWLRVGALIHDLGNMAIPADLLQKADVFSADERDLVKTHTLMGDAMVRQLDFPDEVRPIVRSHHEQWAGTGYPDKLAGDKIPFGARIVSVADVWDALTSPRSFREAYSKEEALQIMERDADQMFDPTVFSTFRDMLKRGGFDS